MINNLQALYKADFTQLPEKVVRSFEATEEIQQLRQDIKAKIPGSNWSVIRVELLSEMEKLLDIELRPILIESWKTHQDVIREIKAQQPSTESSAHEKDNVAIIASINTSVNDTEDKAIVCLSEHEIRSSHSPSLTITIEDITLPIRTFIGITLELNDVSLLIQQGEIKDILSGNVKGRGFMQYQNATLIEKEFLKFDITSTSRTEKSLPKVKNQEEQPSVEAIIQPTIQEPTQIPQKPTSASSNMLQFIIGISIALIAVYLFWQFK